MISAKNILVTGLPGVGKTTLVRRVATELVDLCPIGFYTAEIREAGVRKGFELVSLDGRRSLLSHMDVRGPHRVGKYGVDVDGFEVFLDTLSWPGLRGGLVVIDEIGKMECFSEKFQELVRLVLDSETRVLATVARRGGGLIAEVKGRADSELIELTAGNRDALVAEIVGRFT